jgi:SAM-dependent methyltransferase
MIPNAREIYKNARALYFKNTHAGEPQFTCPVCGYEGPFMGANDPTGFRQFAKCPKCSALERHRLQALVLSELAKKHDLSRLSVLHFAPEPALARQLRGLFADYKSADLYAPRVDFKADLRALPFADASYDVVIASHVLEHIQEDTVALREIRRILKPGGFALLPVPLIGPVTVEYPEPNLQEWGHVRAPGYDYFDRFQPVFRVIDLYRSSSFDRRYQPFVYEDRSAWPTPRFPLRVPSAGDRHEDVVPVCYA